MSLNKVTLIICLILIPLFSYAGLPPITVPYAKPAPGKFYVYPYGLNGRPCPNSGGAIYGFYDGQNVVQSQSFTTHPLVTTACDQPITWSIDKWQTCIGGFASKNATVQDSDVDDDDATVVYQTSTGDQFTVSTDGISGQVCSAVTNPNNGQLFGLAGCKNQYGNPAIIICCYTDPTDPNNTAGCDWSTSK